MHARTSNVFLLSRRWHHHAVHSGYDLLARYIGQPLTAAVVPTTLLPDSILWRLNRNMLGYDRLSLGLELVAAKHMTLHRNCLYHFLYGDNCYNHVGHISRWQGHKLVATYHHPPSKLAVWLRSTQVLSHLSTAIIVGSNQYSFFRSVLPPERIACIPHAVDTSYFVPPTDFAQRQDNLCLFVGTHLRDFTTLSAVIEEARFRAPQVSFVVVVHPQDVSRFDNVVGRFTLRVGITDDDLLTLYQHATLFIQPLWDGTANTALLEAISCGLPPIITDIGAIRDYVNEDCACLVPPFEPYAMLDAILHLLRNDIAREHMAIACRARALLFDWLPVSQRIRDVYTRIITGP